MKALPAILLGLAGCSHAGELTVSLHSSSAELVPTTGLMMFGTWPPQTSAPLQLSHLSPLNYGKPRIPSALPLAPAVRLIGAVLAARWLSGLVAKAQRGRFLGQEEHLSRLHELIEEAPRPSKRALGGDTIRDADYLRFLIVARWDVSKASEMVQQHFKWRHKAKPRSIRYAAGSRDGVRGWKILDRRTKLLEMPCTHVMTAEWEPVSVSLLRSRRYEENLRHITFFMEEMVRKMPTKRPGVTGAVMLLDMGGFRMPNLPFVRAGVQLCQAQYPCRLGAVVAYNLPAYFPLIWRIASPWFNEDIKSKIVFPPRHLKNETAVLDWLDERERKREKPFALAFMQMQEHNEIFGRASKTVRE